MKIISEPQMDESDIQWSGQAVR